MSLSDASAMDEDAMASVVVAGLTVSGSVSLESWVRVMVQYISNAGELGSQKKKSRSDGNIRQESNSHFAVP